MGVLKFPQLGLPQLWGPITSHADLWLPWGLRQSCSHHRELLNGMLHAAYTQGNWVNSRLLVVGNQIASLTPDLSFGHNLCFKCPNGWCEPILNVHVSIIFQCYKKLFKPMGFDARNCTLKIWESNRDFNSHNGSSFGSVRVHSLTFFAFDMVVLMTILVNRHEVDASRACLRYVTYGMDTITFDDPPSILFVSVERATIPRFV
jgi:hypothetical protein